MPSEPKLFATTTDGEVPPRILESAEKSLEGLWYEPTTIYKLFKKARVVYGERKALAVKRVPKGGKVSDVDWAFHSWNQYYDCSLRFAKALLTLQVPRHGVINILGFNAPEWFISFMGAGMVGAVAAGIYTTNGPAACHYITKHSDAQVVVVDSVEQLKKYKDVTEKDMPKLKALVLWGLDEVPAGFEEELRKKHPRVTVVSFDAFLELGQDVLDSEVERIGDSMQPGHCATLIYTSGTTGPPKAVMLSHDNMCWTANRAEHKFPDRRETDSLVSYLPLSHIAAQMIDLMLPLNCGGCIYFAQPDALRGSLIFTLREVRPNFFFAVPRVWEKMYEKMQEVRKGAPLPMRLLSDALKRRCKAHVLSTQFGEEVVYPSGLGLALKLFGKVKEQLGLDQSRYNATGAAPMSVEVTEYFASIGIPIYEVFGQSESTGLSTSNCPKGWKVGTVGQPYSGIESRLDPESGELQYRGRNVFMGYLKMNEETKATILPGGWLRSGDVATHDADHDPCVPKPSGFFKITGRIKELIITAGGENIPPVLIEDEIKAALPGLSNAMVVGDSRKFLAVLLTLHVDEAGQLIGPSEAAGKELGSSAKTVEEVKKDALWNKYLNDGIKVANKKATSRAQCVQKFALLPQDFSEPAGDLTPTLKLKRSVVAKKYAKLIDSLYEGTEG